MRGDGPPSLPGGATRTDERGGAREGLRFSETVEISADSLPPPPARRLAGRYRLGEVLGRGGFGEVRAATDELTGRTVAVKLYRERGGGAGRVRRESTALRLLRVEGVARLLDEGFSEGVRFVVMEYVEGRPFPGLEHPTPWAELRPRLEELLRILARVHDAGVVHRDLKPDNVLVRPDGRPVVLDFGLAHGEGLGPGITREGVVLGTRGYLSPEQCQGRPAGPAADLFAVGIMAYEALTGRRPHQRSSLEGMLRVRASTRVPPLAAAAPGLPVEVGRWVDGLLELHPADRPRSAREALAALSGERSAEHAPLRPLPRDPALDALLGGVRAGARLRVTGPPGSGRSTLLDALEAELHAARTPTLRALAGEEPFAAFAHLLDPASPAGSLRAVEAAIRQALAGRLREGAVLLVDDPERLDRWSARVLDGLEGARVVVEPARGDGVPEVSPTPRGPAALRELFEGPEVLHHLPEDAAARLWERAGGLPGHVVAELRAWLEAGLAEPAPGGRVRVDREALTLLELGLVPLFGRRGSRGALLPDHLAEPAAWAAVLGEDAAPGRIAEHCGEAVWRIEAKLEELGDRGLAERRGEGWRVPPAVAAEVWTQAELARAHRAAAGALEPGRPGRLQHLLRADRAEPLARECLLLARRESARGRVDAGGALLGQGLLAARSAGDPALERLLLEEYVLASLRAARPERFNATLYELGRARPDTADLEALVRGADLAIPASAERALEQLEAAGPIERADLERWRHALLCRAARMRGAEAGEAQLAAARAWAAGTGDPEDAAAVLRWTGMLRYAQGRFRDAAELHEEAAELAAEGTSRLACLVNAAEARLECFDLDRCEELAAALRAEAATRRHLQFEGHGLRLLRAAQYRAGTLTEPDFALLDASEGLAPSTAALIALNEAAVAWRAGLREGGRGAARVAEERFRAFGQEPGARLALALRWAMGEPSTEAQRERLAREALAGPLPMVGLQVAALVGVRPQDEGGATSPPAEVDKFRLEVLSPAEIRERATSPGTRPSGSSR